MAFDDIAGRVVLVTGAARGIGRSIAAAFLDRGARVAITDKDATLADVTAGALDPRRTRTRVYALDVTDADAFLRVVARVEHEMGPLDVVVNNAGIMPLGRFTDLGPTVERLQFEINVFGVMNGMRAVVPRMRARRRGHVVNIASTAGVVGIPYAAGYSASKHAVVGLTEAVRREEMASGIDFSYILPIPVKTDLMRGAQALRWPPIIPPESVADAVIDAVRTGKVDVFVPKSARLAVFLQAVAPRTFYERFGKLMNMDRLFGDVDQRARAAYHRRILGEEAS